MVLYTLLLFDEIYDFLMELGVLDTASASAARRQASSGSADVSGQTPNSGWANRLLQTGLSVHETKTCGCFGGLHTPTVNASLAGNFHPWSCGGDASGAARGSWMSNQSTNVLCHRQTHSTS